MTKNELDQRIRYIVHSSVSDGVMGVNNCYCPATLRHALEHERKNSKRKSMITAIQRRIESITL